MSNITALPLSTSKARDHVTLSIEELALLLAEAENAGYRRGVHDADIEASRAVELRHNHWLVQGARAKLWASRVRQDVAKKSGDQP